ncbi:MAG TPA: ABC transporter permease [Anaerolineae bacterium]|nr:ABC transporter permease [Anaerolineae bacterium]
MALQTHYVYVILVLIWIISAIASPYFRMVPTYSNILTSAVPIALIGLAQTVVVISRGFDLSVGAVASMATAVASVAMVKGIIPSIILVLIIAVAIGAINGLGVTKLGINPFIMTLCMMFFLSGLNLLIRPSPGGYIPDNYKEVLLFQVGDFPLTAFLILVCTAIVGSILLQRRRLGREIYAVGGAPERARMSGINVDQTLIKTYIISAIASALGGLFIAARIGSGNAEAGAPYLFDSFTTVFMGGTLVTGGVGGYGGTLGAALIISSLGRILQFLGINIWNQFIAKGALLASVAGLQIYFARKGRQVE